jgi:hypothetical protein
MMIPVVDHLVYAAPELAEAVATIGRLFGCDVVPGGSHEAWGTRNALVSLGDACYLEIIGPDPEADIDGHPVLFGIDTLDEPRLVTWAAKGRHLEATVERVRSSGVDLGGVFPGSRLLPDGLVLSWQLTNPFANRADGVLPFLIDWGDSQHPAATLPEACHLVDLSVTHGDVALVQGALQAIGAPIGVSDGDTRIIATIRTPNGDVELT